MADSKLLSEIAERLGFKTEDKRNRAYGIYNGIPFVIDSSGVYVTAEVTSIGEAQKEEIKNFIKKNRKKFSIAFRKKITEHTVRVSLKEAFETGRADSVIAYMEEFSEFLMTLGLRGGCFFCGAEGVFPFGKKDEEILTVCDSCFSQHQKDLEALKEERAHKGSYLTGFLGSLLGAAAGILFMFMIWKPVGLLPQDYIIPFIPVTLGIIELNYGTMFARFAFVGYKLFNGKFDKHAAAFLLATLFIAVPVATFIDIFSIMKLFESHFGKTVTEALAEVFADKHYLIFAELTIIKGISAFRYFRKAARRMTGKDLEIIRI